MAARRETAAGLETGEEIGETGDAPGAEAGQYL